MADPMAIPNLLLLLDTYERSLLGFIAVLLYGFACVLVYLSKSTFALLLRGSFLCKIVFHMTQICAMVWVVVWRPRLVIPPRVKVSMQADLVVFCLICSTAFDDGLSVVIGFFFSIYTIPLCKLLYIVDDIGFFESFIGMSVSAIINLLGNNPIGWSACLLYIHALLFIKFEAAGWLVMTVDKFRAGPDNANAADENANANADAVANV